MNTMHLPWTYISSWLILILTIYIIMITSKKAIRRVVSFLRDKYKRNFHNYLQSFLIQLARALVEYKRFTDQILLTSGSWGLVHIFVIFKSKLKKNSTVTSPVYLNVMCSGHFKFHHTFNIRGLLFLLTT